MSNEDDYPPGLRETEPEPDMEAEVVGTELVKHEELPDTAPKDEVSLALVPAYQKASVVNITKEEAAALAEPFPDSKVAIRPNDGLLYIPHILVSGRLTKVLGPGQWAMIRCWERVEKEPSTDRFNKPTERITVYAKWVMLVRGAYVGESVGAQQYVASNPKSNYSDALEGTRGECLRRIAAKDLDCGSQVWDPDYSEPWKGRHAKYVGKEWVKVHDTQAFNAKVESDEPLAQPSAPPPPRPQAKPAPPKEATEKTKEWFLKFVRPLKDQALNWFIDQGWILPNEGFDDIPLEKVPTTSARRDEILSAITGEEIGGPPVEGDPDWGKGEVEWWKQVIVPIPPRGMRKADYDKSPITIGELAEEDSKRFFGYCLNFTPKGWTGRDGKARPPSDSDIKFREALDAACDKNGWDKPEWRREG